MGGDWVCLIRGCGTQFTEESQEIIIKGFYPLKIKELMATEEVDFTICPQCDSIVTLSDLEDHLFAHDISDNDNSRGNDIIIKSYNVFDESRQGIESHDIITEGIIPVLIRYYTRGKPAGVKSVSLSAPTSHISSTPSDFGWGCGYRNIQMLFSSLLDLEPYKSLLLQKVITCVPNILKIQDMIETAWSKGFDSKGCLELNGKVKLTKKWIGTTEAASVFRMLNINAQVVDFARPTGPKGTHPLLFQWIINYFKTGNPSLMNHLSATSEEMSSEASSEPKVNKKDDSLSETASMPSNPSSVDQESDLDYPPIYLQHEGHSRTVVGIEERDNEVSLLLLDPSLKSNQMHKVLMDTKNCVRLLKKGIDQFKQEEYEIVFIDGILDQNILENLKVISPYQRFPST